MFLLFDAEKVRYLAVRWHPAARLLYGFQREDHYIGFSSLNGALRQHGVIRRLHV